jgi:hypothetical protein
MHRCIGDVIDGRYETAKIKCGVRRLFSLEPCYTFWPVCIDKSWPITHTSSQFRNAVEYY